MAEEIKNAVIYDMKVTAPIVLTSVAKLIGTGIKDVGRLCTSNKINKWAIYKPQNSNKIGLLTLDDRKTDGMGLIKKEITAFNKEVRQVPNTPLSDIVSNIMEWEYKNRTPPYRLHDFMNGDHKTAAGEYTGIGYRHNATPPDKDWSDVEEDANLLESLRISFTLSLGTTSADLGSSDAGQMPLVYIQSNLSEWYLGAAVYVGVPGADTQTGWYFIRGNQSLAESTDRGSLFPCFGTNQWLVSQMQNRIKEGVLKFTFIPCILVNPINSKLQEQAQRTYISMNGRTIYSMPSGAKNFNLIFNIPITNKMVPNSDGGEIIDGSYSVQFPNNNNTLAYIIKPSRVVKGRTLYGWFLTQVRLSYMGATWGNHIYRLAVVYAKTNPDSKILNIADTTPIDDCTVRHIINYKYLSNIGSSGQGSASWSSDVDITVTKTINKTDPKISMNVYNDGGTAFPVSFYGYLIDKSNGNTLAEPGLTVNHVKSL